MKYVGFEEFKAYQKIQHNYEDDVVEGLIDQAEAAVENYCRTTFEEYNAPGPVKLAVMLHAGYHYEHRSGIEEKSYEAMDKAFVRLIAPYSDPEKEF